MAMAMAVDSGTGTGTVAPRGEDEWLRVHGRVVAMLPQVEALAAARARLEAVNALQHEFWEARDALLQHRLLQAEESVRRWEAAYIDLQPSGDDQRFAELQRSDLEDLATFVDVFAAENAEFQIKVKEVHAGADHSQNPADHKRITEDLKAELRKLKQAYEALCSEKDKKVSEITAEKDFVRDQFKTLERDYADFRSYMNNKSTQASEAALELQKNVEQLQVASQKKDEEIRKLRARVKAAEAKRKSVPESKLQKMDSMPKKIDEEIEKCKDRQPEASQRHKKDTSGTPKKGCSEGPALVTETRNYSSNQMLAEDGRPEASQKRKCATFLSNVSSEESKARSSVAVQGKLEGQQVHCTLPNIQKMSSTSRIESCGEMNIDFGFKAQEVMQAAAILDEADRLKVVELGYSTFLNLKLGPISQRKETYQCMKLVDLEEDRIKVQLQNDVIVYIRPDEIHDLLMLPQGPKAPLKYNMQQHPDFKQLRSELGETGRLDTVKILELMEKEENKQLRLKCFFLILFSRFLMPTTSQTINVNAVMYTRHLASLKEFDMCTIVYLHLRESIKLWKKQSQDAKPTSLTMYGCPIIILVFIVDNLKLTDSVNKNRPRINEYNMATLMETICKAKDNGKISFENWKLKSLEEICYAQSSRFCILSAVDSQDVRSAMAISAVPESQAIQSAVQILSSVHNPESFGFHQAQVDACIAGLSALQPVGIASCSNAGASCSISEAAASTKKADEGAAEDTSNAAAAMLMPTEAAAAAVPEAANTAVPEAANTAVQEVAKSSCAAKNAAKKPGAPKKPSNKPAAAATMCSARLNAAAAAAEGVTSPIRKQKRKRQ